MIYHGHSQFTSNNHKSFDEMIYTDYTLTLFVSCTLTVCYNPVETNLLKAGFYLAPVLGVPS